MWLWAFGFAVSVGAPTEKRCGWLGTHAAFAELEDADGAWNLWTMGGHLAEGELVEPQESIDSSPRDRRSCGCIEGTFERSTLRVLAIVRHEPLPLARCEADPALKQFRPPESVIETRCGWYDYDPGSSTVSPSAFLKDKDKSWSLWELGNLAWPPIPDAGELGDRKYVGCLCMKGAFRGDDVVELRDYTWKEAQQCSADRQLDRGKLP